jgi:hypothetical protein
LPPVARSQTVADAAASASVLPEPIYWKQSLFQIPYQWGSAAEPGAAQLVLLFVSKDRGLSWHKISEARPNVTSFNYRAEGEGEYWFAVRTLDRQGQAWPTGAYQPELRVIVDTTMPQIAELRATLLAGNAIDLEWSGSDLHLDASSWKFEAQRDLAGPWEQVRITEKPSALDGAAGTPNGISAGRNLVQLPAGRTPLAIRATVLDRAGNSATYQTAVQTAPTNSHVVQRLPAPDPPAALTTNLPVNNPFFTSPSASSPQPASPAHDVVGGIAPATPGWVSGSAVAAEPGPQSTKPTDQDWPANATARAPFRLWSGGTDALEDAVTSYGNPIGITAPTIGSVQKQVSGRNAAGISARYAATGEPNAVYRHPPAPGTNRPTIQPLAPFREEPIATPAPSVPTASAPSDAAVSIGAVDRVIPPHKADAPKLPANVRPKSVGSRSFALEYELEHLGPSGVSAVVLWGTRDGGQTWRNYTRDDDNRSPLVVTVDDEGLYGFRIVVESGGDSTAAPPAPGDQPELWVDVDLRRPIAELTAIELGNGDTADQLILRWRATDDNFEARPISLFYNSRPVGPWSAIATNLENSGEYRWRVERHVPAQFYLRLEARDAAGNLAAFQTRDPVEFSAPVPSAQLNSAGPLNPAAAGSSASYR